MGAIRPGTLGASSSLALLRACGQSCNLGLSLRTSVSNWRRAHLVLQMGGPATPGLAAIPGMSRGDERPWAHLGLRITSRWKHSRGEAVLLASPLLGSREIRGNYPKRPLSKARRRGCRDGLRTGLGRGDVNLHPSRLPTQLPAVSRRRHFRQPTRPGLSPRPDHPPWGALTAQRVPPLPPPSPKWRRRRRPPSCSSPSSRLGNPSARKPRPREPDLYFSPVKPSAINELFN